MNEMNQLSRFRDDVPFGVTPRAEQMFRTALDNEISASGARRCRGHRPGSSAEGWPGCAPPGPSWRYAMALPAAAALAAGLFVAVQPSGAQPMTVQLLADRAAAAALSPAEPVRRAVDLPGAGVARRRGRPALAGPTPACSPAG